MISRLSRSTEGDHEQQLPFGLPAAVAHLRACFEDHWIPTLLQPEVVDFSIVLALQQR